MMSVVSYHVGHVMKTANVRFDGNETSEQIVQAVMDFHRESPSSIFNRSVQYPPNVGNVAVVTLWTD